MESVLVISDDPTVSHLWRIVFSPLHVYAVSSGEFARASDDLIKKYPKSMVIFPRDAVLDVLPRDCRPMQAEPAKTISVLQCPQ